MIFETLTEQRWRHKWQVVREVYRDGVVTTNALSSHRTELVALLIANARNLLDGRPDRAYDVRDTPEVVR